MFIFVCCITAIFGYQLITNFIRYVICDYFEKKALDELIESVHEMEQKLKDEKKE